MRWSLLEYRRGDFSAAAGWLEKCSTYPGEAPSCTAASHVLLSMALLQLGRTEAADGDLKLGQQMIDKHFQKKLEIWDNVSGHLEGWLTARLFLRQAEEMKKAASMLEQ